MSNHHNLHNELLPGSAFSRPSAATHTDFEGLIRQVGINEAVFDGARRRNNLLTSLYPFALFNNGGGAALYLGNGRFSFDAPVGARAMINYSLNAYLVPGNNYVLSFKVETVSGAPDIITNLFYMAGATVNAALTYAGDGTYASDIITASANNALRVGLGTNGGVATAGSIIVSDIILIDVTAQSNKVSSSFVENADYVQHLNGNTVDSNNFLIENIGAQIAESTLLGIKIEQGADLTLLTAATTDFYFKVTMTPTVNLSAQSEFRLLSTNDSRGVSNQIYTQAGAAYNFTPAAGGGGGVFTLVPADFLADTPYDIELELTQNSADYDVKITVDGAVEYTATETGTLEHSNSGTLLLGSHNGQYIEANFKDYADVIPDIIAPVITLTGSANINITVGGTYTEQGATALDNIDDVIPITIGGDAVDTNTTGTYVVTYNAVDAAGNNAIELTRTIYVLAVNSGGDVGEAIVRYRSNRRKIGWGNPARGRRF